MGLVNQLLQLYEECRAANRDVCLSFELRDGVESFLFKNILRPSSPPPSSGRSRRTRRRQRGPRRRNRPAAPPNAWNDPGRAARVLPGRGRAHPWSQSPAPFSRDGSGTTTSHASRSCRSSSAPPRHSFSRDIPPSLKYGRGVKVSPAVPHSPPSPKTPAFTPPLSRHLAWTSHLPSPTPIPQLDGDNPEPDEPRLNLRTGPDLRVGHEPGFYPEPGVEPEPGAGAEPEPAVEPEPEHDHNNDDINYKIVFNSIICKNAQDVCSSDVCSNEVCNFLNYGSVRNEKFKDAKICTNYREWRKCPKHDHLPTNDCILSYLLPR